MTAVPSDFGAHYRRDRLPRGAAKIYDRMTAQIDAGARSGALELPDGCGKEEVHEAYRALRDDRPEYFFLSPRYLLESCGARRTIKDCWLYTPEQCERITRLLRKKLCLLTRGAAWCSPIERETLVYERLARGLRYDNRADARDHNAVGPVLEGTGVCEGHNALLLLALRRVGIPCIKVIGKTARGGAHCWCVAWIDGAPVHCDVTWEKADCGAVPFAHFNLTDEQIAADHFAFRSNGTPRCTKAGLDFYSQNGLLVKNAAQLARLFREQRTQNAPLRAGLWADPEMLHAQIALALAMAGVTGGARYLCGKGLKNVLVERV